VQAVEVAPVQQPMYNLTVDVAHTFFVGEQQWLVHNAGPCPSLLITNEQIGKKIGKHAQDYGLDPSNPNHRNWLQNHIEDIGQNYEQVRQDAWNPHGGGGSDYFFFQKGRDVVVSQSDGTFVTLLKDGIDNKWFDSANILE